MFGIGLSELLVILCVIIIFVRPRDLPKLFRRLGRMYAQLRSFYDQIAATKDDLMHEIEMEAASAEKPRNGGMDEAFIPYAHLNDADGAATDRGASEMERGEENNEQ